MKKVLIIGEMYSENLGDGIICETVEHCLKNSYITDILDMSGRDEFKSSENYFSLKKEIINYIKEIVKKILYSLGYKKLGNNLNKIYNRFINNFNSKVIAFKPDSVIFAGGQMFIDTFVNQIEYVCNYCENNDISVIFNCVGSGKCLYKEKLINLLNNNSIKYISVRDSYNMLSSITSKEINDCYDNAVICNRYYEINNKKLKKLGVGIMFSPRQSPIKQVIFWKKVIRYLIDNNLDFQIFTNGSTCDQSFAEYLLKKLKLENNKYLITKPTLPEELIQNIVNFQGIISMRLHSIIVAYSYDIPSISISWDKKVDTFYSKIGCPDRCFNFNIKMNEIKKFYEQIDELYYDEKIKNRIELSIEKNLKNIFAIIENK